MTVQIDHARSTAERLDAASDAVSPVVLPSPMATLVAGGLGTALGIAVISGLVLLHVHPLLGVAVVVALFTLALAGPRMLTRARTEGMRSLATALNGLAFGGSLGALGVMMFH